MDVLGGHPDQFCTPDVLLSKAMLLIARPWAQSEPCCSPPDSDNEDRPGLTVGSMWYDSKTNGSWAVAERPGGI